MLTYGSLFSGYGGLELGVQAVLPGRTLWHSDIDPGACKVLAHRWPDAPNLGDIAAVDWAAVPRVDVLTGGFPCQDVSYAGRRAGLIRGEGGTRSGLWAEMLTAITTLRPRLVVAENVRGLLSARADSDMEPCPWCLGDDDDRPALRALGAVLADLADIGYDAQWYGLRAADVGAPHGRFRVFVFAWPAADTSGHPWRLVHGNGGATADADRDGRGIFGRFLPEQCDSDRRGREDGPGAQSEPEARGLTLLPTPGANLGDNGGPQHPDKRRAGGHSVGLADADRWGDYAAAIDRWERILGRPAPDPTEPAPKGGRRLSPAFVEWLMGTPAGHVTDPAIGLTRTQQLKALGNGVVPAQSAAATRAFLEDFAQIKEMSA